MQDQHHTLADATPQRRGRSGPSFPDNLFDFIPGFRLDRDTVDLIVTGAIVAFFVAGCLMEAVEESAADYQKRSF